MTASFFRAAVVSTITALLLLLGACNRSNSPLLIGLPLTKGGDIHLAFENEVAPVEGGAGELPVPSADPRVRDRPAVVASNGTGCYFARSGFYHKNETGLRLSYCSADINADLASYVEAAFQRPEDASAIFRSVGIEGGVLTPAALRDHLGPLALLYCERECSTYAGWAASTTITSSPFTNATPADWLPRRFYEQGFDLAVASAAFTVIHRIPGSTRLFYLRIDDANATGLVRGFLKAQAVRETDIFAATSSQGSFVSGVYPASVGGSDNERLILSSGDAPVRVPIETGGQPHILFLMRRSSVVLRKDSPSGFRFVDSPDLSVNRTPITVPAQDVMEAVPGRVITRSLTDGPFAPGAPCVIEDPCSPEDLHPSLFSSFPRETLPDCRPEDLELTEANPFGMIRETGGSLDPAGKFLEFMVLRSCINRTLLIRSGELRIGLPFRLESGILVVAASRRLFEVPVVERTELRGLHPDSIQIYDATGQSARIEFVLNPQAHYIPGTRTDGGGLRRVHSLTYGPGGFTFHDGGCKGILRSLCKTHAMNPGTVEAADQAEITSRPVLYFSEEVPFGAQRFMEFFCVGCNGQRGMMWFRVIRDSDQREDIYVLPVPDANRVTISAEPVCGMSDTMRIHFADIYIPAQAHRILISTEEIDVSTSTYSLLRAELRSLVRSTDGAFRPSIDPVAEGCAAHATPGSGFPWPGAGR